MRVRVRVRQSLALERAIAIGSEGWRGVTFLCSGK